MGEFAFVVVIEPFHLASQHGHGFGAIAVAVDRHHCSWFQGVEHTLALVGRAVA